MYYMFLDGVVMNDHNTIYINGNIHVAKIHKLVNFSDNNYLSHNGNRTYI